MKKMRKLVPAFAMLMVAAIMMSTASFAWFTMNDEVTATGMQIQAKATGSLIIDTAPLTFAAVKTDATIDSGNHSLRPVTYDAGWKDLGSDKNTAPTVDYNTGKVTEGTLQNANMVSGQNYFDQVVYIGSAGDTLTNQTLTITLTAPNAPTEATYAYSVAIYDCGSDSSAWTTPAANAAPTKVVSVCTKSATTNVATINNLTIPTIVGVGAQDDTTAGLKLVLRFFVDGALVAKDQGDGSELEKPVFNGYAYQAATGTTINTNTTYYIKKTVDGATVYEAVINPTADALSTYFVRVPQYTNKTYNYINSAQVPTLGSTLDLSFSAQ